MREQLGGDGEKSLFLSNVRRGDAEDPVAGYGANRLHERWLELETKQLTVVRGREDAISREELLEAMEEVGL